MNGPLKCSTRKLRPGQVWKSIGEGPSAFLIGDVREVQYTNGDNAIRVYGVLITGVNGINSHERDLDARSLRSMFPVIAFEPEFEADEIECQTRRGSRR